MKGWKGRREPWRRPWRGKRLCARWDCPSPPQAGSAFCAAHEPEVRRGY